MFNRNVCRVLVDNCTEIEQKMWEVWIEYHLRLQVHYDFHCDNFYKPTIIINVYRYPFHRIVSTLGKNVQEKGNKISFQILKWKMDFTVPISTEPVNVLRHYVAISCTSFHSNKLRKRESTGINPHTPLSEIWMSLSWFLSSFHFINAFLKQIPMGMP